MNGKTNGSVISHVADADLVNPFVTEGEAAAPPAVTPAPATPVVSETVQTALEGGAQLVESSATLIEREFGPGVVDPLVPRQTPSQRLYALERLYVEQAETLAQVQTALDQVRAELAKHKDVITKLHQRIQALEKGRPAATNRFERKVETNLHEQVVALPGFEQCSGLVPLGPGEKCRAHGDAAAAHGCCPKAFTASKMLSAGQPAEKIVEHFQGKK